MFISTHKNLLTVNLEILPLQEELDENHDEHCYVYDEASEEHEGSWEVFNTGVVDQSVERVGNEINKAGDEGERGENSPHFRAVH